MRRGKRREKEKMIGETRQKRHEEREKSGGEKTTVN